MNPKRSIKKIHMAEKVTEELDPLRNFMIGLATLLGMGSEDIVD
jgi:hypothetical protein